MKRILSIETSCDETAAAVTQGRKILSNVIYSQIEIHSSWGGVVPHLAKREHEARIDEVINSALDKKNNVLSADAAFYRDLPACRQGRGGAQPAKGGRARPRSQENAHQAFIENNIEDVDYIAVTYGPGLAPALEVGIRKAKELAKKFSKKIIAVDHMEGHIYSCFAQNSKGNPSRDFKFPILALLVSGGHTEIVLVKDHLDYQILGETIDDASGEALDKAAKMLGLGYPGGPVIERLAEQGDSQYHHFPRPMMDKKNPDFSFSGLKTSLFYFLKNISEKERLNNLENIAASYQEAVFDVLITKFMRHARHHDIKTLCVAGGVSSNKLLRKKMRAVASELGLPIYFPVFKSLYGDNAAMIGIAAYYKSKKNIFVDNVDQFDRQPSLKLGQDF